MLVKDHMTCSVKTATLDTPVVEVVSLMCLHRYSGLPVVDEDNKLIGFIAEKDVLHKLFPTLDELLENINVDYDALVPHYRGVVQLSVKDVMSEGGISVSPDMHLLKAATVMVRHRFRRIPVVDGGILKGMLSLGDVHKAIFQANVVEVFKIPEEKT